MNEPDPVPRQRPRLPDADPPESYRLLAGEYPWLAMAAGAGIGLLVGALVPRKAGAKLAKQAVGLAAAAGELGLALSARAREQAETMARQGLDRIEDGSGQLRSRAQRSAAAAKHTGADLLREALKVVRNTRK